MLGWIKAQQPLAPETGKGSTVPTKAKLKELPLGVKLKNPHKKGLKKVPKTKESYVEYPCLYFSDTNP